LNHFPQHPAQSGTRLSAAAFRRDSSVGATDAQSHSPTKIGRSSLDTAHHFIKVALAEMIHDA
jgi:hypothetical protein